MAFLANKGSQYCIGGDQEKRNIEIVKYICQLFNKKNSGFDYCQLIEYVTDRKGHDKRYAIDNLSIKNDLGWFPKVKFEVGIDLTIDWYLKNVSWTNKIH